MSYLDQLERIRYRKNIRQMVHESGVSAYFLADSDDWITVNGTHILINENGTAQNGGNLKGENFTSAKSTNSGKSKPSKSPSSPSQSKNRLASLNKSIRDSFSTGDWRNVIAATEKALSDAPIGSRVKFKDTQLGTVIFTKKGQNSFSDSSGKYKEKNAGWVSSFVEPKHPELAPEFFDEESQNASSAGISTEHGKIYEKLTNSSESDLKKYVNDMEKKHTEKNLFIGNGTLANYISISEGLDRLPSEMSNDEFETYCKNTGATKIYRGVVNSVDDDTGDIRRSGKQIKEDFATSKQSMYGGGGYGNGYHFSSDKKVADGYAMLHDKSEGGAVIECAIKPDAKFYDREAWDNVPDSTKSAYDNDIGLYALVHGFDGVASTQKNDPFYIVGIVNRGCLVFNNGR